MNKAFTPDRTDQLWAAMPPEVRAALRAWMAAAGKGGFATEIGRHYLAGAWSVTPYPGAAPGFATLTEGEATALYHRLEQGDG